MTKNKNMNITPSKGLSIIIKMNFHHHQQNQRRKENINEKLILIY